MWIGTYCAADDNKFRDIETTLAEFEFRHKRLALTDPLPKFYLRYARVLPSLHQQFDYPPVKIGTT